MAKSKRSKPESSKKAAARNSRATMSGPAAPDQSKQRDDLAEKMAATEEVVSAIPYNPIKAQEYDPDAALAPPSGEAVEARDPIAGASTVTEANSTEKAGSGGAPVGMNPTVGSLDRVRVDSTGRALTTNQGVPVADNQNSLKVGLRGPTLIEDFIL